MGGVWSRDTLTHTLTRLNTPLRPPGDPGDVAVGGREGGHLFGNRYRSPHPTLYQPRPHYRHEGEPSDEVTFSRQRLSIWPASSTYYCMSSAKIQFRSSPWDCGAFAYWSLPSTTLGVKGGVSLGDKERGRHEKDRRQKPPGDTATDSQSQPGDDYIKRLTHQVEWSRH